jgi:uncharacterized membrane protein
MSDLVVLAFGTETGAAELRDDLMRLQKQKIIELEDAAVVVRKQDGKVKVKQATSLVGEGALALGALGGAIGGSLTDVGIDDKFIKEVGDTIEPGHSALFLLVAKATPDKLADELKKFDAKVLQTSLSHEDEEKLRSLFGAEEIEG